MTRADGCSRHSHKELASIGVRRDHGSPRPPLLIQIAARVLIQIVAP